MKKNVGAGIIFISGESVLLLQNEKGSWEIPGGKKNTNEKLLDTAQRETAEEIGKCPSFQKIGHYINDKEKFKFKIYYGIVKNKFKCTLSDEHESYRWFNIKKLPQNLHPKIVGAIEFLKKSLFSLE